VETGGQGVGVIGRLGDPKSKDLERLTEEKRLEDE